MSKNPSKSPESGSRGGWIPKFNGPSPDWCLPVCEVWWRSLLNCDMHSVNRQTDRQTDATDQPTSRISASNKRRALHNVLGRHNKSTQWEQTSANANLVLVRSPYQITSEIKRGFPCSKLHLWQNFHEDPISLSRDMSQIVEKCPISQRWRILLKNSWIRIRKRITSKI